MKTVSLITGLAALAFSDVAEARGGWWFNSNAPPKLNNHSFWSKVVNKRTDTTRNSDYLIQFYSPVCGHCRWSSPDAQENCEAHCMDAQDTW